ncbi:MAG: TatD family hydrolase [Nanoarchaeota archaeon]|nr:TatD family hydrolase [Nanoarchaeota archaeon]MBU0977608.1 TatD family hydrolase [Nanoarchaeota archaeon]
MFIDVHCHLDFFENEKIEDILNRARKEKIGIIVCNGVKPEANRKVLGLAARYSEVRASLGLYPTDALKMTDKEIDAELDFIKENGKSIIAIGEVGLDFKETGDRERQVKIFEKVIKLALKLDKPLIVHSRKAEKEAIEVLEKAEAKKVVMHCFSGNFKLIQRIVENGWKMTIPTNVKSSEHFQQVIARVPLECLLCETDSPFLHPDKKEDNEPANVIESYKKIAEIKNLGLSEVERIIEENFKGLF